MISTPRGLQTPENSMRGEYSLANSQRATKLSMECDRAARRDRILMCAPDNFGVEYVINPWMENQIGEARRSLAWEQWMNLRRLLSLTADLTFITPVPGLPDMVFTANAGLVIEDTVVVSRFRAEERRSEEEIFRDWFDRQGFTIAPWPADVAFEGAGDALVDCERRLIWCGHGWRSSARAAELLEMIFAREAIRLRLVDPRFYHLDTCFCPLAGGWLMYYPPAFDADSREVIAAMTPERKRIEVSETDAMSFACNSVDVDGHLYMNDASDELQSQLRDAGFAPVLTPLSEFLKAGGSAKCLTLKLTDK